MAELNLTNLGVETIVKDCLSKCVETIKENSRNAGQVATGKTLASLEYRLEESGNYYVAKILGRKYFGSLETGRGIYNGGKADIAAFNARLVEWFKARGIHSEMSDEQLLLEANRLRWYINKYGTKLYQRGGRKDIFSPAVAAFTDALQEQLLFFFQKQLTDMFTDGFQGFGNSELSITNN